MGLDQFSAMLTDHILMLAEKREFHVAMEMSAQSNDQRLTLRKLLAYQGDW